MLSGKSKSSLFSTLLKISFGLSLTIFVVYMIVGYGLLYILAEIANKKYEAYVAEAASHKKITYKIPDEVEEKKPVPLPEKIIEVVKKKPEPLPMTREKTKITRITGERVETITKFISMADQVVYEDSDFDPCHSICNNTNFDQYPRGEGAFTLMRNLADYYESEREAALNDPVFNSTILLFSSVKGILSPQMLKLASQWRGAHENIIQEHPVMAAGLLLEMPFWIYKVQDEADLAKQNGKIVEKYREFNKQCLNGKVNYKDVHQQCTVLFNDYHYSRAKVVPSQTEEL